MKVWHEFGSEHSMKLVMIGRFKEARDAKEAKDLIDRLTEQVRVEQDAYRDDAGPQDRRFTAEMSELLRASNLFSLGPADLDQLTYDARVHAKGREVEVRTDEVEVSAFLKILLDKGARVEVYSAHRYPDREHESGG